eukprot:ctg_2552.g630
MDDDAEALRPAPGWRHRRRSARDDVAGNGAAARGASITSREVLFVPWRMSGESPSWPPPGRLIVEPDAASRPTVPSGDRDSSGKASVGAMTVGGGSSSISSSAEENVDAAT